MELLWKQYEKHIDLYKFYLETVIKLNAFHYLITGAILSYYFANSSLPNIKWSLLLPAFLSLCLVPLFGYGAKMNLVTRQDLFKLRDKLELKVAPDFIFLTIILGIFCIAHLVTTAGLIYLMFSNCS